MSEIQRQLDNLPPQAKQEGPKLAVVQARAKRKSVDKRILAMLSIVALVALAFAGWKFLPKPAPVAPVVQATPNPEAKNNDAVLLFAQNKAAAASVFEVLSKENPNNGFYRNNAGVAALSLGQLSPASESLEAAAKLEPQQAKARNNYGAVLTVRGQFDTAEQELNQAAQLDSEYLDPYLNLGILYEKQSKWSKAEAAYFEFLLRAKESDLRRSKIKERVRVISSLALHERHQDRRDNGDTDVLEK